MFLFANLLGTSTAGGGSTPKNGGWFEFWCNIFPIHSLYLGPLSPLKLASLKSTSQIFPLQQKALKSLGVVFVVSTFVSWVWPYLSFRVAWKLIFPCSHGWGPKFPVINWALNLIEQWKNGPWLFRGFVGDDFTAQLYGDYNEPLWWLYSGISMGILNSGHSGMTAWRLVEMW